MPARFTLGDHTFLHPSENAPLDRGADGERAPIRGAPPPDYLVGIATEHAPGADGPGAVLEDGEWCGHGEPTFTIFTLTIDGSEWLEMAPLWYGDPPDEESDDDSGPMRGVAVRPSGSGGRWLVLADAEWGEQSPGDATRERVYLEPHEAEVLAGPRGSSRMRVAIGFEYPADATGVNEVSWLAIAAAEDVAPDDALYCFDCEMA